MARPTLLHKILRVLSAAALLIAVATSPIRPARLLNEMARRDCLGRKYEIPPAKSTRFASSTVVTSRPGTVKALPSEGEEELGKADCPVRLASRQPTPPSFKPTGAMAAPRSGQAVHPLRC
jgi:hypothetical protein